MKTKPQEQHTPGPWEVDSGMVQTVAEHTCKIPGCGVHIPIAWMDRKPGNGTMPVERDANARLIAAAPELFNMLIEALPYIECAAEIDTTYKPGAVRNLVNRIRKVVDKVEVQS